MHFLYDFYIFYIYILIYVIIYVIQKTIPDLYIYKPKPESQNI